MREPLQESREDAYERPNQPWLCGLSAEGTPCPMGPGRRGRCPAAAACHPVLESDRWRCNRSAPRGGICKEGPSPEGECCHVYQCTPLMSLRSQRARFVVGCALATLGSLCLLLSSNWRNKVLSPGPLSAHHAQLLERDGEKIGCSSCHAAGNQTVGEWLQHATDNPLAEPSQTELCMKCHDQKISHAWATAAHSVDPAELLSDTLGDRRVDPHQALACAICHEEHHGASHDLKWMSDKACQACHKEQYDSFATDHPEFVDWPAKRRTRIAFDHAAHEAKHFSKKKQTFTCAVCHQQDSEGDFQQTLGYDAACASCHDRDIEASWEEGVALFSLPMLDLKALDEAGHDVGQWPELAAEEFDGALPLIAKLLLVSDPQGAESLGKLGADFDFFDIDVDDPEQMQAASDIVWAMKELLFDVSENGHAAVRRRVEALLGREISPDELARLVAHLSPESLAAIGERWLPALAKEIAARQEEAIGEVAGPDEELEEIVSEVEQDRAVAKQRVEAGGWFRDDVTLSIRYRATGHEDSWTKAWIEVLAEASNGPHTSIAQPLLKQMMKPTAPGQCGQCHSVDQTAVGEVRVNWFAKQDGSDRPEFTRFSHRPHLVQSQLRDCQACHAIDKEAMVMVSYAEKKPDSFEAGFLPIARQDCAGCHTPQAAGDSCLQCHKYHVD
ncbi:MAG: hypothetical protein GXP24_08160 [Planctomycetes bacterium]|nr:hypothetical protein [Planctomycetota bacterium]